MNLYSLLDKKALTYGAVSNEVNDFTMQRSLSNLVNGDPNTTLLAKFPEDFDLYQVGVLDQITGAITPKLGFVCNLSELKDVHQKQQGV